MCEHKENKILGIYPRTMELEVECLECGEVRKLQHSDKPPVMYNFVYPYCAAKPKKATDSNEQQAEQSNP